ncbi:MAG TPA: hypothetical protein VE959_19270 [Bryobacteraceae bacterium]|nr:hypothetical protein [Bryobacteraceae bacterium]
MLVFKRKNRILTLRITDEDYLVLRQASLQDGARSLSDYARDSLLRTSRATPPARVNDLELKIEQFQVEMQSLGHAVRRLQENLGQAQTALE